MNHQSELKRLWDLATSALKAQNERAYLSYTTQFDALYRTLSPEQKNEFWQKINLTLIKIS